MNEEHAREIAIRIRDEFEELLAQHAIRIPSSDRTGDPDEARLYGSEYYALEDAVVEIRVEELGVARTREQTAIISKDTRAAVGRMQKAMAAAPEGLARLGPGRVPARKALGRPKPRCGTSVWSR